MRRVKPAGQFLYQEIVFPFVIFSLLHVTHQTLYVQFINEIVSGTECCRTDYPQNERSPDKMSTGQSANRQKFANRVSPGDMSFDKLS